MKLCQWEEGGGCGCEAVYTERFCPTHRRAMLRRMRESGYLVRVPKSATRPEADETALYAEFEAGGFTATEKP
jgi:hypothetical protein